MLDARINGIPCKVKVNHFREQKPSYNMYSSEIPEDFYGDVDMDYEIYDRKGYRAGWLSDMMTQEDREEIEQMIIECYGD